MSTPSFIELTGIRWRTSWWNFKEFLKVASRFYTHKRFRKIDTFLLRHYLMQSPFKISKEYGEIYGETPLTTLETIVRECNIQKHDVFYELGCGRGRGCFWVEEFTGAKVVGIELIPAFIRIAQSVKKKYQIERVKFFCQDMLEADLSKASVIYYFGTCAEDAFIQKLCERLPTKRKIITVSFPLSDYSSEFKVIKRFEGQFPWGTTDLYLQVKE